MTAIRTLLACAVLAAYFAAGYVAWKHNQAEQQRLMEQCLQEHKEYECVSILKGR